MNPFLYRHLVSRVVVFYVFSVNDRLFLFFMSADCQLVQGLFLIAVVDRLLFVSM